MDKTKLASNIFAFAVTATIAVVFTQAASRSLATALHTLAVPIQK